MEMFSEKVVESRPWNAVGFNSTASIIRSFKFPENIFAFFFFYNWGMNLVESEMSD